MNYFILITGAIILCLVLFDISVTTLAPRGTGFITRRLRVEIWRLFYWISGGDGTKKILNYAGLFTITAWLFGWILMLWVGNSLIFISDEDSIISDKTGISATLPEKVYFVGYVLSTMGLGDFKPNGNGWQIYTSIISFSGFAIMTLGITYLVPVLSAEMGKRQTSIYMHSLGTDPNNILINSWDGEGFTRLSKHFTKISDNIIEQSQNHLAYPILHNFHSNLRRESIYITLSALDEALTILLLYIPDDIKPHKHDIYPLRYAITDYLYTLQNAFISSSENEPGPLQLDRLKKHGIPLKEEDENIKMQLQNLNLRRRLLLGMMENDGWEWESIYMEEDYADLDIRAQEKE